MTMEAKIGLALSGGAILGAAHIGVLKAFDEEKIPISAISGTSIGAFVAALYAFGDRPGAGLARYFRLCFFQAGTAFQ